MDLQRWLQPHCTVYTWSVQGIIYLFCFPTERHVLLLLISHCLLTSAVWTGACDKQHTSFCQLASSCTLESVSTQRPVARLSWSHPKAPSLLLGFNKAGYGKHACAFLQDWLWRAGHFNSSTFTLPLPVFWWVAFTPDSQLRASFQKLLLYWLLLV